jgi:hypothetical protein
MIALRGMSGVALTGVLILIGVAARQPAAQTPVVSPSTPVVDSSGYAGADACKDCHVGQFEAWSKTKHARALSKLPVADRAGGPCIKCHVTGSDAMIEADGATPRFPNVQCEGCHGPGQLHIEAAKTGDSVTSRPKPTTETTCTRCHNDRSPHYKPFFHSAMVGLVHQTK